MARPIQAAPIFKAVVRPFQRFFQLEAASGILLLGAAAAAMVWANTAGKHAYHVLLEFPFALGAGGLSAHFTTHELINDGLMTLFFFVVGMEIKRELVRGELRTPSRAALPAIAAVGGMVVPALIYVGFNRGGPGAPGWAIPMATDIAFSLGCISLLQGRVPHGLVVFLTALAIFDDMGGILVIALFYGHGIHLGWLLGALGVTAVLLGFNRAGLRNGLWYAAAGAALWLTLHEGGVHATLAGVVMGLTVSARPFRTGKDVLQELHSYAGALLREKEVEGTEALHQAELLQIEENIEDLEAPLDRFVHALHPWVAYFVMPLFALANAGVELQGLSVEAALGPVSLGAILGLFVGKQVGIFAFTLAAVKAGVSPLPGGATVRQVYGVAILAGIGFTVALFIASLAFPRHPELLNEAKLGILLGSALSGVVGLLFLRMAGPPPSPAHTA